MFKTFFSRLLPGLLLLWQGPVFAQNPTFQKTFSSPTYERGWGISELSDGYLIAGSTNDTDTTYSDALLIRTDLNGNILWQKTYGGYSDDEFHIAKAANDGGLIVFGTTTNAGEGPVNAWLLKLDDAGNILWQRTLGQTGQSTYASSNLIVMPDGYILTGARITDIAPKTRGFVTRVDNNGEVMWSKIPFSNRYNYFTIQFAQDGLLYGCGGGYVEPFGERVEAFWVSMDAATGEVVQSLRYFSQEREDMVSIRRSADGNLIMSGVSNPYSLLINSISVAWVQKVQPDGTVIWAKTYQVPPWYHHSAQLELDSDGFILNLSPQFKASPNGSIFDEEALLAKIDDDGEVVWNKVYGGAEHNHLTQIRRASDGGWLGLGTSATAGILQPRDLLVVKTDTAGFLETCCSPQWSILVSDFVDTVMTYETAPINFAMTIPETELAEENTAALAMADACGNPQALITDTLRFCPGQNVTLGGTLYDQPGTVQLTLPAFGQGCDTLATYVLEFLPQPTLQDTIQLCPGETILLNGTVYDQPGVVSFAIPANDGGCDTLATYVLEFLPQPTLNVTIQLCPGETITLNGTVFDQPGIVSFNIPSIDGGCDTLATYVLEDRTANQPNSVSLNCPANITMVAPLGNTAVTVNYTAPQADSDCPCPGVSTTLVSGGASGSDFPIGVNTVCYRGEDACGNSQSCCFTVTVEEDAAACDVKTAGCIQFELLEINRDNDQNWFYHIRVTNNCTSELAYAYFQVPDGLQALAPPNNATFTAPGGRKYLVRNPNFSPFYSLRFKPGANALANGQSDVFSYALPPQASVLYIDVAVRLASGALHETHLNTFNCPIGDEILPRPAGERGESVAANLKIYPNPLLAGTTLRIEGGDFRQAVFVLQDLSGKTVFAGTVIENQVFLENAALTGGMYFFKIMDQGQFAGSGKLVVMY